MKTFEDLKFFPWGSFKGTPMNYDLFPEFKNCKHAIMNFPNGYGVSVVFGTPFYSNGIDTYEVAILYNDHITYSTNITDDVIGYVTEDEVSKIMEQVQNL